MHDLTRPEAPRVRDAFSGMVNFLKFRSAPQVPHARARARPLVCLDRRENGPY